MKLNRLGIIVLMCVTMVLGLFSLSASAADTVVAKIGDTEYTSLQDAIDAAADGDVIKLLSNVTLTGYAADNAATALYINKGTASITIDGGSYTIDCASFARGIRLYGSGVITFKNVNIVNKTSAGRCFDIRSANAQLTLDNVSLSTTGAGNNQPITVGGSGETGKAVSLTIKNSSINAGVAGYGILTFNPAYITIDNTEITGYAALYLKDEDSSLGSDGTVVSIVNSSSFNCSNDASAESNSDFAAIVIKDDNVTVKMDGTCSVVSVAENTSHQSVVFFSKKADGSAVSGSAFIAEPGASLEVELIFNSIPDSCTLVVPAEYASDLNDVGFRTEPFEGSSDWVKASGTWDENHVHDTEVVIEGEDATCTETGITDGAECSVCGKITLEQEVIPAKGHTEETVTGKDATCTEPGLTDGKVCSDCDTVTVEQEVIPAKGHTEETVTGKDATCTETGLTDGKVCSDCDTVTVKQEVIPAKGHTEETVTGKDASCTETGLTDGKVCSDCDTVTVKQEVIPALGHKFDDGKCTVCEAEDPDAGSNEVNTGSTDITVDVEVPVVDDIEVPEDVEVDNETLQDAIQDTVDEVTSNISNNATVNDFKDTNLDNAVENEALTDAIVEEIKNATGTTIEIGAADSVKTEVSIKTELKDVKLEAVVNDSGAVIVVPTELSFDVKPVATMSVNNNVVAENIKVSNELLNAKVTFRLPVPDSIGNNYGFADVLHNDKLIGQVAIKGEEGGYYVEVETESFSNFKLVNFSAESTVEPGDSSALIWIVIMAAVALLAVCFTVKKRVA